MKTFELLKNLENIYPLNLQDTFDNAGGQIVFGNDDITGIIISMDVLKETVDEAIDNNCNLIITHHPILFKPLKTIIQGDAKNDIVIKLLQNKITVYSMHTNADKILSSKLSDDLGFFDSEILIKDSGTLTGYGSLCRLNNGKPFSQILTTVKEKYGIQNLPYTGDLNRAIYSIAVINGSGGSFIPQLLLRKDIDCIITGDINYHNYIDTIMYNKCIVDMGHFYSESVLLKYFYSDIIGLTKDRNISVNISIVQKSPIKYF